MTQDKSIIGTEGAIQELEGQLKTQQSVTNKTDKLNANRDNVEQGLAKLVLTLVELIRKLMEEQAVRRMENGSLTDEQIEEMGMTFLKLEEKMDELVDIFNLNREELNLDLGPLGNLM